MSSLQYLDTAAPFHLESGAELPGLRIAYQTWGTMAPDGGNVVWICHALTANADAAEWWSGLIGPGKAIDTGRFFVICANAIGSCYGSTGPVSHNPAAGRPWFAEFPDFTLRDMVQAHILLRNHLGVDKISLLIGGSMGGQQALEWCIQEPDVVVHAALIATNAFHSPWGVALNATQRMAIEADQTWGQPSPEAGRRGLAAARAIAMLSYRGYAIYQETQADQQVHPAPFRAETYQRHQGNKLVRRFPAYCYWYLSRAMDSHHVGRGRGSVPFVLGNIRTRVLVVGISSDILFPTCEQKYLASHIPNAAYAEITSRFGHDGFLVETERLSEVLKAHFKFVQPQFTTTYG